MRRIDTENIKSNQNVLIKKGGGASAIKYYKSGNITHP